MHLSIYLQWEARRGQVCLWVKALHQCQSLLFGATVESLDCCGSQELELLDECELANMQPAFCVKTRI